MNNRNFSLACAVFNGIFCVGSLMHGNIVFGAISGGFAVYCYRNYLDA